MSHTPPMSSSLTANGISNLKDNRKISMVTCYDYAFARLVEQTAVDVVLVGDSLGNVVKGYDSTTSVTMDDMVEACKAVRRGLKTKFLCVDMPFLSYRYSLDRTLENAGRLISEGGAQAVKLEGGAEICEQVANLVDSGIPVMGHLGLTPQSINTIGGYKVQGRTDEQKNSIIEGALALEKAGVFAIVLELIPRELSQVITKEVRVPTLGIGAGNNCDGQVLVLHDLLGFDDGFNPRFLKKYCNLSTIVQEALEEFAVDVKSGSFPSIENSFSGENECQKKIITNS